jgi:hypothetical protein
MVPASVPPDTAHIIAAKMSNSEDTRNGRCAWKAGPQFTLPDFFFIRNLSLGVEDGRLEHSE